MKEYAEKRFEVKKNALNIASVTLLLLFVFSKDLSGERGWLALSEHFLKFFQVPALSWTRHLTIKCSYFFKQLLIFIFSDAFMQSILQSEKKDLLRQMQILQSLILFFCGLQYMWTFITKLIIG